MRRFRSPGRRHKSLKPAPHSQRQRHERVALVDAERVAEAESVRLHGLPVDTDDLGGLVMGSLDHWNVARADPDADENDDPWWDHEHDRDDDGDWSGLDRMLRRAA